MHYETKATILGTTFTLIIIACLILFIARVEDQRVQESKNPNTYGVSQNTQYTNTTQYFRFHLFNNHSYITYDRGITHNPDCYFCASNHLNKIEKD